jgi:hypothetical protein
MKAHYVGLESGSWICHGREGRSGCEKPSGETVSAHFADVLDDPEWEMEQVVGGRWFVHEVGGQAGRWVFE